MKIKQLIKLGTTTLTAVILLSACGSNSVASKTASSSAASSDNQVLTRMEKDVISTMDSSLSTDIISGQALVDTMDGLYRYNGSDLEPAIATKVSEPTSDGKIYTFKLRKNAKWSNGDPVTAKDFVYAWQRTVDPATGSQYSYLYDGIKNAEDIINGKKDKSTLGIKAIDDYTVEVTLDTAIPYFSTMMAHPVFFPQDPKVVEAAGKNYGTQSKYIVSNGPFVLTKWDGTNNTWTEVKNKTYWNAKKVKLSKINVQVIKDSSTALNLFQSNKIDDAELSGEVAQQMTNDPSYVGLKQSRTSYVEFNQNKIPAFKNAKIRQAFSLAINRKELVSKVIGDGSVVATSMVPSGLMKSPDGKTDFATAAKKVVSNSTKYDLTKAKKLWKEGLKETGVSNLDLEILSDDTDGTKKVAEYLQSALQDALPGLKLTVQSVPFKTRLTRSTSGNFDLVLGGWSADFPDAISFLDLFTSKNSYNRGKWNNAEYDKLIQQSKTTDATDADARWKTLLKADEIITEQEGALPLDQVVSAHLVNTKIKEMNYSPAGLYNFVNTYVAN